MNENIRENIENSRDTKLRERATRTTPATYGGFTHPGLFQTASYGKDLVGLTVAIALEAWTLGNLVGVAGLEPGAAAIGAVGLGFVDVAGALAAHCGKGAQAEARCRIATADTPGEGAAIRVKIPRWHSPVRALGILTILLLATAKIVSFLALKSPDAPGGLTLAVVAAYVVVALLHIFCTGYALAWMKWAWCARRERLASLRAEPRTNSPYYINTLRRHQFVSDAELEPCSAHGHTLGAGVASEEGWIHTIETWGRPEDRHVEALVFAQPKAAQKATLAREFLKHQLDVLYSEPLGAMEKKNITAMPDQGAGDGPGAQAAVAALVAVVALGLGGCDSGAKKRQQFDLEVALPSAITTAEAAPLPAEVVEILAPQKPYGGNFIARPKIGRLDQPAEGMVALPFEPDKDIGGVEKFWRGVRPAPAANDKLREVWKSTKVGPLAAATSHADPAKRTEELMTGEGFTVVLAPGTAVASVKLPGGAEASAFATPEKLKAAIDAALAKGSKRVVVIYQPPMGVPVSPKPKDSATEPVPAGQLVMRVGATSGSRNLVRELARGFLEPDKAGYVSTVEQNDTLSVRGTRDGRAVEIRVAIRGSSSISPAVAKNEFDLGVSSVAARQGGAPSGVEPGSPGRDAVVLCVGQGSSIRQKLTLPEIARIIAGDAPDWQDLAGSKLRGLIRLHACADGDALAAAGALLGVKPGAQVRTHRREEDVAAAVADDPMALGLIGLAVMPANLRALPVARDERSTAFDASACNVALGYYPLIRELRFTFPAVNNSEVELARQFAKFASGSPEGRRIAARERYCTDEITLVEPNDQWRIERRGLGDERIEKLIEGAAVVSRAIFFAKADGSIDEAARMEIRRVALFLKGNPALQNGPVIVAGFADSTGRSEANKMLSERRAAAVATVLRAEYGINAEPVGFGERLPVASNATAIGQQLNRRTEILVKQQVTIGMSGGL